ncbi:hypothetical protein UlMin_004741 [Ulmus minor]
MTYAKPTSIPISGQFKFSSEQCPKTEEEKEDMINVPYSSAVGSIMYTMICTRPDVAYGISLLSRFMSNPGREHWEGIKWLLRYLLSSSDVGLMFKSCKEGAILKGYVDSDFAGDKDKRRSTTSYIFTLCDCCVSWKSQLQSIVTLSTTEAEYIATTEAMKEAIWLKGLLKELKLLKGEVNVYSDSQSSIFLCKNPVFHDRTKHIDVKYHFIRDVVSQGIINLQKIPSEFNPADMGTKVLPVSRFKECLNSLNIEPG